MKVFFLIGTMFLAVNCSKKDEEQKKGQPIGAVEIAPPVERNMPSGLTDASLLLVDGDSDLAAAVNAIKAFLYPTDGFVGPVERLGSVDESIAALDT